MSDNNQKGVLSNIANAIKDYGATSSGSSVGESIQGYTPTVGKDTRVMGMRPVNFFIISLATVAILGVVLIKVKID